MFICTLEQLSGIATEPNRDAGFRLLPLPLTGCVTLPKFLNLSVSQFPHLLTTDSMVAIRINNSGT